MNKRQLEVQKSLLQDEKKVIWLLKRMYQQAAIDCEKKIRELAGRTDMENLRSIIYQRQYQEALKKQLDGILDALQNREFENIAEYLSGCYENSFLGTLYDLHGQGIPLLFPIDQRQAVKAIQTDSRISTNLYTRLGEDVGHLKKSIRAELSRGVSNGSTWAEMAALIAKGMNSPFHKAMNNAMRIARTEGHRIQSEAQWDTLHEARKQGADIVKQWDATLDGRTSDSHRQLDGQIRELDEYFEVNGHQAKYPGGFGIASEDIHCRCCMLQRARWALDQGELDTLKERAAYFGLDKTADFEDFKNKYKTAVEKNPDFGIINTKEGRTMTKIQSLGKINTGILEQEFGKIQTDEIIVTNERMNHIQERHPEDYALFEQYGRESVHSPDMIVRDIKHKGTVFMIKKLPDTNLNVVVRVVLETDDSRLKNSIMTFYRIRERNLKKLIEKNGLLYKKE